MCLSIKPIKNKAEAYLSWACFPSYLKNTIVLKILRNILRGTNKPKNLVLKLQSQFTSSEIEICFPQQFIYYT